MYKFTMKIGPKIKNIFRSHPYSFLPLASASSINAE